MPRIGSNGTAESQAATSIQAIWRGHQVRKQTVFPSEIRPFLKEKLRELRREDSDLIDLDLLAFVTAREIQNRLLHPQVPQERVEILRPYDLPRFSSTKFAYTVRVHAPIAFWMAFSREGGRTQAVADYIGQRIGKGGYKEVHASERIDFSLDSPKHAMTHRTQAIVRAKIDCSAAILRGQAVLKQHFSEEELHNPDFRIAGILKATERSFYGELEAIDDRFRGDFEALAESMPVKARLRVLADVLQTLKLLHKKQLIHCDVKPPNILVGADGRGYLADFDLLQLSGPHPRCERYFAWDTLTERGVATPFSDIFGLMQCAARVLFGHYLSAPTLANTDAVLKGELREVFLKTSQEAMMQQVFDDRCDALDNHHALTRALKKLPKPKPDEEPERRLIELRLSGILPFIVLSEAIADLYVINPILVSEMKHATVCDFFTHDRNKINSAVDALWAQFPQFGVFVAKLEAIFTQFLR